MTPSFRDSRLFHPSRFFRHSRSTGDASSFRDALSFRDSSSFRHSRESGNPFILSGTRRLVFLSLFAAFGLVMFVFESFLPVLPWFRPGLGNAATLLALMLLGFGDSVKVTVLRIVLGALLLGRLFTPLFLFAFAGGMASVLVMACAARYSGKLFSPVGISVLGAVAHNMVQLGVAYLVVKNTEMFIFMPIFIATGVVTGALVGIVSQLVYEVIGHRFGVQEAWPNRSAP